MEKEALLEEIEMLRALLQAEAVKKGLRHHAVIEISQALDKKIVQFCKGRVGRVSCRAKHDKWIGNQ